MSPTFELCLGTVSVTWNEKAAGDVQASVWTSWGRCPHWARNCFSSCVGYNHFPLPECPILTQQICTGYWIWSFTLRQKQCLLERWGTPLANTVYALKVFQCTLVYLSTLLLYTQLNASNSYLYRQCTYSATVLPFPGHQLPSLTYTLAIKSLKYIELQLSWFISSSHNCLTQEMNNNIDNIITKWVRFKDLSFTSSSQIIFCLVFDWLVPALLANQRTTAEKFRFYSINLRWCLRH